MSFIRIAPRIAGVSALTLAAGLVFSAGTASADTLAPKSTFTMVVDPATGLTDTPTDGESVPNIDSVKSTIRAYYNATGGTANPTSSRYITQVHALEQQILHSLPASHAPNAGVVFDVDDTLLWTYNYTDHTSNFNFDPATNATAVANGFPAVPGMPELLQTLSARGYAIYGITGRPDTQESITLDNLNAQHFTTDGSTTPANGLFNAGNLFTKNALVAGPPATLGGQPWVDCTLDGNNTNCTTVEYKAGTRKHIETNDTPANTADDVDLVMNVGDQWSDLQGGFAGHPAADANMVPPTSYVMQPDGSSGYSVASGDDIPNADPARKYIRAYYNAPNTGTPAQIGVADKVSSPYITQMNSLTATWTSAITTDCTTAAQAHNAAADKETAAAKAVKKAKKAVKKRAKGAAKARKALREAHTKKDERAARQQLAKAEKALAKAKKALAKARKALAVIAVPPAPALVFDADDTTLWNYDLEDNVMKFVFDPAKQQIWITGHLMPAVPGMVALVKAGKAAGCAIFGLTGRPTSQQADTIANLTEKGYVDGAGNPLFTAARFFTKGAVVVTGGNATIPSQPWVDCNGDGTRGACSTIEYKSGTRGHIESLGFDVVGNFGDQFSDLIGGHADHTYKVPNPTYYLP
jgi:predicted secreted acid phosphatase